MERIGRLAGGSGSRDLVKLAGHGGEDQLRAARSQFASELADVGRHRDADLVVQPGRALSEL